MFEKISGRVPSKVFPSRGCDPVSERPWHRCSAIVEYPGFTCYLEMSGERMRFVIGAKIEDVSVLPNLSRYIDCIGDILRVRHTQEDEIDGDWAE